MERADVVAIPLRLTVIAAVSSLLMLGPLGFALGLSVAPLLVLADLLAWRAGRGEDELVCSLELGE